MLKAGSWELAEVGGIDATSPTETLRLSDDLRGAVDPAAVMATLKLRSADFRACSLAGSAVVRVVVETNGSVSSLDFVRSHLTDGTETCLREIFARVRFPAPEERAKVLIPLVFRMTSQK